MPSKVLLVEDSRTEALRARLVLEREGYQVSLASDGREGLFKAAEEKPDLILLGSTTPQMNGFEACARLRMDPKTCHIPVVILATAEQAADMPSGTGLDCFLTKPYDPRVLVDKVKEKTDRRESTQPARGADPARLQQYEEELSRAKQEIESAKQTRSDFLANMSHELRTPLHEIVGMTDLLLGTDLTPEQQGYLNTAKSSSNTLLSLIGDVIEFSELEAGQLRVQEKEFDLAEPLERMSEIMAPRAAEKGLRFSTMLSSELPRGFVGDANRLRQILTNLVANAIKFTDRGEVSVRVSANAVQDSEVELVFQVSDTGIGIPEDRREIIFDPFQQADTSATRRYGGVGIGLAMAKQLVKLMGGHIGVDSEPGKGSTFHFTVRLKRQAKPVQPTIVTGARPIKTLQILLAEDSPTNQLIAVSSLKKAGHVVTVANNGLQAVRAFEEKGKRGLYSYFDLVLMDVAMPEMDGLEATRTIREKEKSWGGHVPIVAMTAFATKEYQDKCVAAGMDAYVSKPVRMDELSKTIEPLLVAEQGGTEQSAPPVVLTEALEVMGGDVDIMREAVAVSLKEIPEELAELKQAMARQDSKGVEAKAHRLKGVIGNLGGLAARDIAQRLETMGERGNLEGGLETARAFEGELARVVAFYSDPSWEQRARECQEASNG
jgi:signal transduction histidine kinase/HPt (histidine-containing phosphotransfer) domain-containing protein